MTTKTLSIDVLRIDADTQARVKISDETVDAYAEVLENAGKEWPFGPVDVFHDGNEYYVADGFHRTLAAARVKRSSVPCRIHKGTATDAKIFGMTANDTHGLRMTREDKRACVLWLLSNGGKLTQLEIAEKAGVSERTVRSVVADKNRQLAGSSSKTQGKSSGGKKKRDADPFDEPVKTDETDAETDAETDDETSDGEAETSDDSGEIPFDAAPETPAPAAKGKGKAKPEKTEKIDKPEKPIPGNDPGEQQRNLRKMFADHLARAVRLADLLHDMLPNARERDAIVKTLQGVRLWDRR